jgi:hypothetical protein
MKAQTVPDARGLVPAMTTTGVNPIGKRFSVAAVPDESKIHDRPTAIFTRLPDFCNIPRSGVPGRVPWTFSDPSSMP